MENSEIEIDIENRNPVIRNGFLIKSPQKDYEYEFDNKCSNPVIRNGFLYKMSIESQRNRIRK